MMKLSMRPYGKLELHVPNKREPLLFDKAPLQRSKWTHLTLVWHVGKAFIPAIRTYHPHSYHVLLTVEC
jgi:hypothetical protein